MHATQVFVFWAFVPQDRHSDKRRRQRTAPPSLLPADSRDRTSTRQDKQEVRETRDRPRLSGERRAVRDEAAMHMSPGNELRRRMRRMANLVAQPRGRPLGTTPHLEPTSPTSPSRCGVWGMSCGPTLRGVPRREAGKMGLKSGGGSPRMGFPTFGVGRQPVHPALFDGVGVNVGITWCLWHRLVRFRVL